MKQRKQLILRIVAGLALMLVAAGLTVAIRDTLARREPEQALPTMDVYYRGSETGARLPAAHITVGQYTWRFLFTEVSGEVFSGDSLVNLEPAWVAPNSPLDLVFTFEPQSVQVYMLQEDGSFAPAEEPLRAPSAKGGYHYRVDTEWGNGRIVSYYFAIRIPPL